jgi:hypothetical protein
VGMNVRDWQIALLAAVTVLALPTNSPAQSSAPQTKRFSAADGAFQFSYPSNFQLCTKVKMDPCNQSNHSYIPVCEQDALVCVVYPSKEFDGTNFGAASFEVVEVFAQHSAMTPDICVTPPPSKGLNGPEYWTEFLISAQHPAEMIGGVLFVHGVGGGAALSQSISVDIYRAFHKERCFSLSLSETGTDPGLTDPPMKTLTPAQQKRLDDSMSQILHSFLFSN